MRTKKVFYCQVTEKMKDTLGTLQDLSAQIKNIDKEISSGKYVQTYINENFLPKKRELTRQIDNIRFNANKDIKTMCDDYIEELRAEDDLDPSLITDDVKLLNSGVRLTNRDIKAMLNRNSDNHTMTQVILRYCKDNDIETGVHYVGNNDIINNVAMIPTVAETSLKWSDNQATVFDKLMGENSDLESVFID